MTIACLRILLAGSILLLPGMPASAAGKPVAGVDIVLTRNPPPPMPSIVVATTDGSGRFYARAMEAGAYTLTTACRRSACPAHRMSVEATGTVLQPGPGGTYRFVASGRPVVLRGVVEADEDPARTEGLLGAEQAPKAAN